MAIYPPNTTPPAKGLNYMWNFLGSSLKTFGNAITPYIDLSGLPAASPTVTGLLSSVDYNLFNSKVSQVTAVAGGSVAYFSAPNTLCSDPGNFNYSNNGVTRSLFINGNLNIGYSTATTCVYQHTPDGGGSVPTNGLITTWDMRCQGGTQGGTKVKLEYKYVGDPTVNGRNGRFDVTVSRNSSTGAASFSVFTNQSDQKIVAVGQGAAAINPATTPSLTTPGSPIGAFIVTSDNFQVQQVWAFGTTYHSVVFGTNNWGLGTVVDAGYKVDVGGSLRTQGDFTIDDTRNIVLATGTGTKIGTANTQKLSLWNAVPNVQPTTSISAAAFVANSSGIVNDTATFGGYTMGQVVAALKRIGALA